MRVRECDYCGSGDGPTCAACRRELAFQFRRTSWIALKLTAIRSALEGVRRRIEASRVSPRVG